MVLSPGRVLRGVNARASTRHASPWSRCAIIGSVATHRKQESSVSQVLDFLTSGFQIWPPKDNFATEPPGEPYALGAHAGVQGSGLRREHQVTPSVEFQRQQTVVEERVHGRRHPQGLPEAYDRPFIRSRCIELVPPWGNWVSSASVAGITSAGRAIC